MKKDAILLVLDGCRADVLEKIDAPCISELAKKGTVIKDFKTVYPSLTACGHASLITGAYPDKSGIVNHMYWDRNLKKIVDIFNNEYIQTKTVFDILNENKMMGGSFGAFIRKGSRDPISRKISRSLAERVSSLQFLMKLLIDNPIIYNCLRGFVVGRFEDFKKLFEKNVYDFYYLTFYEVDKVGHRFGPESQKYYEAIERIDEKIATILYFIEKSGRNTTLIITSDHGQTTIKEKLSMDLLSFEEIGYKIDEVVDYSGAAIIKYNEGKENMAVATIVSRHIQLWLNNLSDSSSFLKVLRNRECFDLIKTKEETKRYKFYHERTGDITFCLKDGFGFDFLPLAKYGDHGGISKAEINVPLIIWNSKEDMPSFNNIASITDIIPHIICRILNLKT
jgi:predicted AlkP superfamily pyrophosphatase or phosphodiesterase